jgi:hypothetical protein
MQQFSRFARFSSKCEIKIHFICGAQFFQRSRHCFPSLVRAGQVRHRDLGKRKQKSINPGVNFRAGVFLFVVEEKTRLASPAAKRRAPDKVEAGIGGCGSPCESWRASCGRRRPARRRRAQ